MKNAVSVFEKGLDSGDLWMCTPGSNRRAPVDRWHTAIGSAEMSLLELTRGPAIDVGCGPGRLVGWLARNGCSALGVDVSPMAVRLTREQGGAALLGDVFSVDFEYRFATVLLVDGNIGIGGNPQALLERSADLLLPDGQVLCEVGPPGSASSVTSMVLRSGSRSSDPFPWATVSIDAVGSLAATAGLVVDCVWSVPASCPDEERWFARLTLASLSVTTFA